jgi:Leucine-rich repeat (LRR) protein
MMTKNTFYLLVITGIIFGFQTVQASAAISSVERDTLIVLYNATDGDNWTDNSGWKTPPLDSDGFAMPGTESNWFGITVASSQVKMIDLNGNGLSGTIPSELGSLSKLESLALADNQLTGSIPADLGNLSELEVLFLYNNQLSGSLPETLGTLLKLTTLYIDDNQLSGPIPDSFANLSEVTVLSASNNQLSGIIPSGLSTLPKLLRLMLSSNQLTGSIPVEFGSISTLIELNLSQNSLTGPIPEELGQLSNLERLSLTNNQLTGPIPLSLGSLSQLISLSLTLNQLTGTIPTELGNLSNLTHLGLGTNQLSGSIPAVLGNLSNLTMLTLSENQLGGSIPIQLGNLSDLKYLHLYSNLLTGSIPEEIGNLTDLIYCYLYDNQLTGDIPDDMQNLTSLAEAGGLLLCGNFLSAQGQALLDFLDQKSSSWEGCQKSLDTPPERVTLISPNTGISDTRPQFVWNHDIRATYYKIFIRNDGQTYKWSQWRETKDNDQDYLQVDCIDGRCALDLDVDLSPDNYTFWVKGWGENGSGEWSQALDFTIQGDQTSPGLVNQVAPSGTVSGMPSFTWTEDSFASWYRLLIWDSLNQNVFAQWYKESDICTNGTCLVDPGLDLSNDAYTWWIKSWNDFGSIWSIGMIFAVDD